MAKDKEKPAKDDKSAKPEAEAGAEPSKKKKKLIIIAAATVLLLGGGGGAFFFLKKGAPKPAESTEGGHEASAAGEEGHSKDGKSENDGETKDASKGEEKADSKTEKAADKKEDTGKKEDKAAEGKTEAGKTEEGKTGAGTDAKSADKPADPYKGTFGQIKEFKPFNVNLGNPLENRYARISIGIEYKGGEEQLAEINRREPQLRDAVLSVVARKTREHLLSPDGKDQLRLELRNRINQLLDKKIESVFITDMLIE